jgi:chorismate mutase
VLQYQTYQSLAKRITVLCFEADFNLCHRSLVADAVKTHSGIDVKHIDVKKAKKVGPDFRSVAFA